MRPSDLSENSTRSPLWTIEDVPLHMLPEVLSIAPLGPSTQRLKKNHLMHKETRQGPSDLIDKHSIERQKQERYEKCLQSPQRHSAGDSSLFIFRTIMAARALLCVELEPCMLPVALLC
jgi:hypothetical protein